jgi:hypothetical protein
MNRFTVIWDENIQTDFIDAWVKSDSETRTVLSDLANLIDESLSVSPDLKGKPAPEEGVLLVTFVIGLAAATVFYRLHPEDRAVRIIRMVIRRR